MLFGERILVSWSKPRLTTVNLHSFVVFSASTIVLLRVLHICCLLLRNLVKKNCDLVMTFAMPHLLTLAPKKWWNANNCFGEYHETWKRSRLQFHALFNDTATRNSLDAAYLKIYINRKWEPRKHAHKARWRLDARFSRIVRKYNYLYIGNAPNSYSFNLVFWSTIKKLLLFQPRILQFTLNLSPKDVGFYGFRLEEPFCFITQKRLERSSLATGISFKFFNAFILHKNVDNKKLIY